MISLVVIMALGTIALILAVVGLAMKTERQIILARLRRYGFEAAEQAPVLADDLAPLVW